MDPKATHLEFASLECSSPLRGVIPVSSAGIFDRQENPPAPHRGIFLSSLIPQLPPVKLQALTSVTLIFHVALIGPRPLQTKAWKAVVFTCLPIAAFCWSTRGTQAKKGNIWLYSQCGRRKNVYSSKNIKQPAISVRKPPYLILIDDKTSKYKYKKNHVSWNFTRSTSVEDLL